MVNVASIFTTLGNPNSLVPLAIKDITSSAGVVTGSFITGKEEGHDRFIDEAGTEVIWLGGIPFFKWLFDKTVFKSIGLDSKFDARNLKDKKILEKIKEYAPTNEIKNNIEKITQNEKLFKNTATAKFFVSTALTIASYIGLTKFKQNYTDKKIRENLIKEHQDNLTHQTKENQKNTTIHHTPSFKGLGSAIESLAFSPVKNMWVLDGAITTERLKDSRTKQEFIGYAIKEASLLCFLYYAGDKIKEILEKQAEKKHNLTIGLDARVIEHDSLKKAFESGEIIKDLEQFKLANKSNVELYEFLHKNPDNFIVKTAKMSDIIELHKETGKIDTRKYIDLEEIKGINNKLEKLYGQYKEALAKGKNTNEFFNQVKKMKRNSVLISLGSCMFALGVLTPVLMLLSRTSEDNQEFETKKRIREDLIKKGIIV